MAVSINNQVSTEYAQVIQSVQNRRRIDEQQGLEQAPQSKSPAQEQEAAPQQVPPAFKAADQAEYEQVYQSAAEYFKKSDDSQYGISAYKQVQDQAHRDDLQSMLGFSVYA